MKLNNNSKRSESLLIMINNKTLLKHSFKKYYRQLGFSLTEIMVVVAIIGVLSSIAIPQYAKYQRKARQTEAKLMLGGIYTANMSFNLEWGYSTPNLYQMGFSPNGEILYNVGFDSEEPTLVGSKTINNATASNRPDDYDGPPPPPNDGGTQGVDLTNTGTVCGSAAYGTACTFLSTPSPIPATLTDSGTTYNIKVFNNVEKYSPKLNIIAVGNLGGDGEDIWMYEVDAGKKNMFNSKSGL